MTNSHELPQLETTIRIVENLQRQCVETYNHVLSRLRVGMSEVDIAELMRLEFERRGITEFWYNVPLCVLIGAARFKIGTTTADYAIKSPSKDVFLEQGSPVFFDVSPMDTKTKQWGDWSGTVVFHPRPIVDDEQIAFLKEVRQIHREGIQEIDAQTTGAEVATYYREVFEAKDITLLDARNNVGHSLHSGPKASAKRIWLDETNTNPLGEGIFAVEPGGRRSKGNGNEYVVGRFEDSVYMPKTGRAVILGSQENVPLVI